MARLKPILKFFRPKDGNLHWGYIGCSLAFLLIAAYLDNIRGPLLPVIRDQLEIDYEKTSWFLVSGNFSGAIFSILLLPLLNQWNNRKLGIAICVLTILATFSIFNVRSFPTLVVAGSCLGIVMTLLGTMSNIFLLNAVPQALQGRALSGMHSMYGLGSFLGPVCVALSLNLLLPWPWLFVITAPALLLLIAYFKFRFKDTALTEIKEKQATKLRPRQIINIALVSAYVCAEVATSMWMTAFIVEKQGLKIADASLYASGFFAMMCFTRVSCFLFAKEKFEKALIYGSLMAALIFFLLGHSGMTWAFCLTGINGAFFPLYIAKMRRDFPDMWRSVAVWIFVSMQAALGVMHLSLGSVAKLLGVETAYYFPAIGYVIAIALLKLSDSARFSQGSGLVAAREIAKQK